MMRILLIDDEKESVQEVYEELKKLGDCHCEIVNFDNFQDDIERVNPHIIILDLLKGTSETDAPGLEIHGYIWGTRFCPLIFYTGRAELVSDHAVSDHPFIKVVTKGNESELRVVETVQSFKAHIDALKATEREIHSAMNGALREVAPDLFKSTGDTAERSDILVRSARRRVAAKMDEDLLSGPGPGKGLKSWECYLHPPVIEHLLMGDILRKRDGDKNAPENYAVVLTPSCDLARAPKVSNVLVGHCTGPNRVLQDLNIALKDAKTRKTIDKLESMLTTGYTQSTMPLPAMPGAFPGLIVDLRNLGLLKIETIGESKEYERVASIDNPWRELLAWAFMLTAGRPGMPDRDFETWAAELSAQCSVPPTPATTPAT
jgi:CTP synthase